MPAVTKIPTGPAVTAAGFNGAWANEQLARVATSDATAAGSNTYATAATAKAQEFASLWPVAFTSTEVPAGSVVDSVAVKVQWKASSTASELRSTTFADSAQTTALSDVPGVTRASPPSTDSDNTYTLTTLPTVDQLRSGIWVRVQILNLTTGKGSTVTGSLDYIQITVTYSAAPVAITGSGGSSTVAPRSTGMAAQAFRGSAASSLGALTSTGVGASVLAGVTGAGASTFLPIGSTGTATAGVPGITGTASSSLLALASSGTGSAILPAVIGAGVSNLRAVQATAIGTLLFRGAGTSTLTPAQSVGEGSVLVNVAGEGASSLDPIASTGAGAVGSAIVGIGASTLLSLLSDATGALLIRANGVSALPSVGSVGAGTATVRDAPPTPSVTGRPGYVRVSLTAHGNAEGKVR